MKKRRTWTRWAILMAAAISMTAVAQIVRTEANLEQKQVKETFRTVHQDVQELRARLAAAPQQELSQEAFAAMSPLVPREGVTYNTIDELCGDWVANWESPSFPNGIVGEVDGGSISMTPIQGTDSVLIENFWCPGSSIRGKVNLEEHRIDIPQQKLITFNGDPYYIVPWLITDDNVMLDINDDGTLMGYCVVNKRGYKVLFERANGKLHATQLYPVDNVATTSDVEYNVVVAQPYNNLVQVKNFGNAGQTVDIELDGAGAGTMSYQLCAIGGAYEEYAVHVVNLDENTGRPLAYAFQLPVQLDATDHHALSVSTWMSISVGYYYRQIHLDTRITSDVEIQVVQTNPTLEGEGTAQSPFLIRTADDLMELASQVNGTRTTNATDGDGVNYAKVFEDTYFALANDIDMTGYHFAPIGRGSAWRFAGTFDGQGHTISNLYVSTEYQGYAGLFGFADSCAVIRDLTLDHPIIRSRSNYAGAVVARFQGGTLTNCHVTHGDIEVTGVGDGDFHLYPGWLVGGMAGVVNEITHCTISDSRVSGYGGWIGGLAAEVDGKAECCEATDMNVLANYQNVYDMAWYETGGMGDYRASGGLFAWLNQASATDCCFSGVMGTHDNEVNNGGQDKTNQGMAYQYSWQHLGGISGRLDGGTISRCFVVGRVYRGDNGSAYLEDDNGIHFYVYGDETGGLVGLLNGQLSDCYIVGDVYVGHYSSGCLVAAARQGATIDNCFAVVQQDAPFAVYALHDGQHPSLSAQPAVSHVFYDAQVMRRDSVAWYTADKATGLSTTQLTDAGGFGLTGDQWSYREGFYPVLKGYENHPIANWGATAIVCSEGESLRELKGGAAIHALPGVTVTTQGKRTRIDNDSIYATDNGRDSIWVSNGTSSYYYVIKSAPFDLSQFEGEGTEASPYLIKNKEDWIIFSSLSKRTNMAELYFRLTNDIDLEYTDEDCTISRYDTPFAGVFDGGNHAIHGFKGKKSLFVAIAESGFLHNLKMAKDNSINSPAFCGGNRGLIERCINFCDVLGPGIVGSNSGIVRQCVNIGNVIGFGISNSNSGTFEQCVNIGAVTQNSSAAGMFRSDEHSRVIARDCINLGNVTSNIAYGISEYGSTSECVINAGIIIGNKRYGLSKDNSSISHGYWDGQLSLTRVTDGWTETAQLTDGHVLEGFDTTVWSFEPGMYPMLKWCADIPEVQQARRSVLTLPSGITVDDMTNDGELAQYDGLTWSLAQGTDFTIEGNVLKAPSPRFAEVNDTLVADWGGYNKQIPIKRHLTFAQAGTADDPYLINTAEEWNALATYKNNNNVDFAGKVLKITADLDFTDMAFVPWQGTFNGTMLGNGKSLVGISHSTEYGVWGTFGTIGTEGVVQDLTLEGTIICNKGTAGAFASSCSGLIQNCVNRMDMLATETTDISRLAGFVGGALYGTVANCSNYGTIRGYEKLGGIVNMDITGGVVLGCANYGDISGLSVIGGIVADGRGGSVAECVNHGTITSQQGKAGGIAGDISLTLKLEIADCLNVGEVSTVANSGNNGTGGIVGQGVMTMTRCVNIAPVNGYSYVGGLVGNPSDSQFAECYSYSNVTATTNYANGGGGNLFGVTPNSNNWTSCTATNCYYVTDGATASIDTSYTQGIALAELCAMDMNVLSEGESNWTHYDGYSLPMPAAIAALDVVKTAAAEVIVADGDTRDHVTQDFHVGVPDEAVWTISPRVVSFMGNRARLTGTWHDLADLTVTVGDFSKVIQLLLDFDNPMDVTGDGKVDIADVNAVINVMLGKATSDELQAACDVTGDGKVDIADVNAVINAMLGKSPTPNPSPEGEGRYE